MLQKLNQLDFNLLLDLDALLREGSVIGAARSLHLSSPAMSRRLTRLREAMGDELFVPAGRGLVPTERALALRLPVQRAIEAVRDVLTPTVVDFKKLTRTFTVCANDGFSGSWAAHLSHLIKKDAPGVCLHFIPRADRRIEALRRGSVDLEIGVSDRHDDEIHAEILFAADFVGVARRGHPLLKSRKKNVNMKDIVAWDHVSVATTHQGSARLDQALRKQGLQRQISIVAPGFQAALVIVANSDMIAVMPKPFALWAMNQCRLETFKLPVPTARVEVSQYWHLRHHMDPVHRWFRTRVKEACPVE